MNSRSRVMCCCVALFGLALSARADSVTLTPIKDNTLIEDPAGALSNGSGDGIYCGRVGSFGGQTRRRAVLAFDIAGNVPAGATVTSATLNLYLLQTISQNQTHTLHRLLADWGEGTSSYDGGQGAPAAPGDATWIHRFFPLQQWSQPGGDFAPTISASQSVGIDGPYVWGPSAQLTADVQDMLDNPAGDFGWLMRGNEAQGGTAKRFGSREHVKDFVRPMLVMEFDPPPCAADLDGNNIVDAGDLALLLGNWGTCPACPGDLDGDGVVDSADLALLLGSWGPC